MSLMIIHFCKERKWFKLKDSQKIEVFTCLENVGRSAKYPNAPNKLQFKEQALTQPPSLAARFERKQIYPKAWKANMNEQSCQLSASHWLRQI